MQKNMVKILMLSILIPVMAVAMDSSSEGSVLSRSPSSSAVPLDPEQGDASVQLITKEERAIRQAAVKDAEEAVKKADAEVENKKENVQCAEETAKDAEEVVNYLTETEPKTAADATERAADAKAKSVQERVELEQTKALKALKSLKEANAKEQFTQKKLAFKEEEFSKAVLANSKLTLAKVKLKAVRARENLAKVRLAAEQSDGQSITEDSPEDSPAVKAALEEITTAEDEVNKAGDIKVLTQERKEALAEDKEARNAVSNESCVASTMGKTKVLSEEISTVSDIVREKLARRFTATPEVSKAYETVITIIEEVLAEAKAKVLAEAEEAEEEAEEEA